MIPLIRKLASRFGFDKPIVVADAGLLSKTNIEELTKFSSVFDLNSA